MQLNHSPPPTHGNRVNSLRIEDFFVAKVLGLWVSSLWRSPYLCSETTTRAGSNFHAAMTSFDLLSSSDPRVHFRPGTEGKVASIEVRWPSVTVQIVADVTADQNLKLEGPHK